MADDPPGRGVENLQHARPATDGHVAPVGREVQVTGPEPEVALSDHPARLEVEQGPVVKLSEPEP